MDKACYISNIYRRLISMITFQKVDMTYAACVAYMVDVMQSRSSEILAAIKFVFRYAVFIIYKGLNEILFFFFFLDI